MPVRGRKRQGGRRTPDNGRLPGAAGTVRYGIGTCPAAIPYRRFAMRLKNSTLERDAVAQVTRYVLLVCHSRTANWLTRQEWERWKGCPMTARMGQDADDGGIRTGWRNGSPPFYSCTSVARTQRRQWICAYSAGAFYYSAYRSDARCA